MNNLKDCGKEYPLDLEREAYTTETGAEVFHIKANLPTSQEGDKQGNGEGVFVLIDEETKKAYNNDQAGGLYTAILDNDSIEWPELKPGTRIPLTLRGTFRPVVPFSWLENYRTACGAWRRHEQAAHGYPEDYPDKGAYIADKLAYYDFIDSQQEPGLYDMTDWKNAGTFSAQPGQEISGEVYEEMLNTVPPISLPRETAERALHSYGIPVHAGYLMGEPYTNDNNGPLFHAFGMNDYGKGKKFYYLGLSHQEELREGIYYFFDCMDGIIGDWPYKPEELRKSLTGDNGTYTEAELKRIAADYEADLYRQEYDGGKLIRETRLYNAWGILETNAAADPEKLDDKTAPSDRETENE